MNKLILTTCKICNEKKTSRGFSQHIIKSHNISLIDYIVKYVYSNVHPTCKCGCGKPVTIRGYSVMDYVDGHSPAGHFKKGITPTRDHETWLKNLTKGIREYNDSAKLVNPLYRSGENNNFFGKHHSEETKENIRNQVESQIASGNHAFIGNSNGRIGKSSLETSFEQFLINSGVDYDHNYKIAYNQVGKSAKRYKYYDFYIPALNKLIELHGTYWHPKQLSESLSETQINNYFNDQFKQKLALDSGYELDAVYDTELDQYMKNFYVVSIENNKVVVGNSNLMNKNVNCYFTVFAERVDVDKLVVEID